MKKTAAVVLCAAMMLTACGGASTTETTAAGSQAAGSETTASAEETKAASGDAQKLVLSTYVRTFLGKSYQYEVETSAGVLKVNMGTDHVYKEGEKIRLYLPKDKLILVRK